MGRRPSFGQPWATPLPPFARTSNGWAKGAASAYRCARAYLLVGHSLGGGPNAGTFRPGREEANGSGDRTSRRSWMTKPPMRPPSKSASRRPGAQPGDRKLWASAWMQRDGCSLIGVFWDTGLFARTGWRRRSKLPFGPTWRRSRRDPRIHGLPPRRPPDQGHRGHGLRNLQGNAMAHLGPQPHDPDGGAGAPGLERQDGHWKITHLIFVPVRNTALDRARTSAWMRRACSISRRPWKRLWRTRV